MLDGTYSETRDGVILSFERRMDKPIEAIWAVLTDPVQIALWMGQAQIEPWVGGRFHLDWHGGEGEMNGVVIAYDPPRLFEHTWKEGDSVDSRVRWSLEPDGEGCRLALTHTFPKIDDGKLIGIAGGWEDFLEVIPRVADGIEDHGSHERYLKLRRGYAEKFGIDDRAPAEG
jgi:uncharacterized protein YndB with AHSA1/START domain